MRAVPVGFLLAAIAPWLSGQAIAPSADSVKAACYDIAIASDSLAMHVRLPPAPSMRTDSALSTPGNSTSSGSITIQAGILPRLEPVLRY